MAPQDFYFRRTRTERRANAAAVADAVVVVVAVSAGDAGAVDASACAVGGGIVGTLVTKSRVTLNVRFLCDLSSLFSLRFSDLMRLKDMYISVNPILCFGRRGILSSKSLSLSLSLSHLSLKQL